MEGEDWPLPNYAHKPGLNSRPEDGFLEAVAALVPDVTDPLKQEENKVWHYGLKLIENGFYWEAHEVLEPVWFHCAPNSRERKFVQALIQYANACLKKEMNRPNAAKRLAVIADELMREAAIGDEDTIMGLSVSVCQKQISDLMDTT